MRQDSLKVPSRNVVPRHAPSTALAAAVGDGNVQPVDPNSMVEPVSARSYHPSGRRDPIVPVLQQLGLWPINPTLPSFQRVGYIEMNLIAVIWGGYPRPD